MRWKAYINNLVVPAYFLTSWSLNIKAYGLFCDYLFLNWKEEDE